jgi:hypothetical protein
MSNRIKKDFIINRDGERIEIEHLDSEVKKPKIKTAICSRDFDESDEIGSIYSNFDHEVDRTIEKLLKKHTNKWASHEAWDHYGLVFFEYGKFKELVKKNMISRGVYEADCLDDLIEKVNNLFGHD